MFIAEHAAFTFYLFKAWKTGKITVLLLFLRRAFDYL